MNLLHTQVRKTFNRAITELEIISKNARQLEKVEELASKLNDVVSNEFVPDVVVQAHVGKLEGFVRSRNLTASQFNEIFLEAGLVFTAQKGDWGSFEVIKFYIENYADPVLIFLGVNEFSLAS